SRRPRHRGGHGGYLRSTGRCRSRDSHSQATAADPVCPCDYSGAAATRSGLGSNPERSSLSGISRGKDALSSKQFSLSRSERRQTPSGNNFWGKGLLFPAEFAKRDKSFSARKLPSSDYSSGVWDGV